MQVHAPERQPNETLNQYSRRMTVLRRINDRYQHINVAKRPRREALRAIGRRQLLKRIKAARRAQRSAA